MKKDEEKNSKINQKNSKENYSKLNYIKINNKSILEVFREDMVNQIFKDIANSSYLENEENIGKEINKFFNNIIPENEENNILKVNYALVKKIKENCKQNKIEIKDKHSEYMTQIMNKNIKINITLTRELNEQLSIILAMFYKKIKKKKKFSKQDHLFKYIIDHSQNLNGILEKYRIKKNEHLAQYNYIDSNSKIYNDDNDALIHNNFFSDSKNSSLANSRISQVVVNNNEIARSVYMDDNNDDCMYSFKELKTRKSLSIPLEVLILKEKFEGIKTLKLILKPNNISNNNEIRLDSNDLINNIFILFNIKWLFPNLIELELDLTNENIFKEKILSFSDKFDKFLKKAKKNKNATYYQSDIKKEILMYIKNRYLMIKIKIIYWMNLNF